MSFDVFKAKVLAMVRPLGLNASFRHDNGRHYANISDGTVIVGNTVALSVQVRWGSGHTARATI